MTGLVDMPAWQALQMHQRKMAQVHMCDLLTGDVKRFESFSLRVADRASGEPKYPPSAILFDYSRSRMTREAMGLLCDLAHAACVVLVLSAGDRQHPTEVVLGTPIRALPAARLLRRGKLPPRLPQRMGGFSISVGAFFSAPMPDVLSNIVHRVFSSWAFTRQASAVIISP